MQIIRELTLPITCDDCGRLTNTYIEDEEDYLFLCVDCFNRRHGL